MVNLRLATVEDSKSISKLHHQYIPSGFLSILGLLFLKLIYESMVNSKYSFCTIAEDSGKITGFVSGAVDVSGFYKEFLKKNFIKAGMILFPKVLNPKFMKKIIEILFYPVKKKNNLPEAELLSIVVEKNYQGKEVSQKLFEKLVEEFKRRNVNQFKVIVSSILIPACRFYEKMGGVLQSEIEVHKGEKSRVYVWRL